MAGQAVTGVLADLAGHGGRVLDDDGSVLLRFADGARGLIAPFAALYREFAAAFAGQSGLLDVTLPGIAAGVRSMAFVESAVESSSRGGCWIAMNMGEEQDD